MSTVGDILSTVGVFSTVGRYLEYRGGVQCREGNHEYHGVILSTMGCSVLWRIS